MTHVKDLQPGDEIIGYMRLGLALEKVVTGDHRVFRSVPRKPKKTSNSALNRFTGCVVNNNTITSVLTVMATRMDSTRIAFNNHYDPAYLVDIHYSAFSKLQLLSKTAEFSEKKLYTSRPTSTQGFGTKAKASRILTNVRLT